ncbi:hypothetical protein BU17DRAFT_98635 [Hysterangium stoloniferum]|nr:hypothetical protein BU17DRAFT_98635 [Hysterangium stoloniferum]
MSISDYPSWLPKRPPPPAPASTYQSSPEQSHPPAAEIFNTTPGRKPTSRSIRIVARDAHLPWREPTGDSVETRVQPNPKPNITMPPPRPQPRFRAPSLYLDLLRSPALSMRIRYILHPVLIFGHLVLQTYFDFNAVFMILQISSHPGPDNNAKNWALAATAYIACYVFQIVGVFIIYELIYSFWRRWRVKRPLILPIYLSSPARNLVALTSYTHYCFLAYIRRSARPSLHSLLHPNSNDRALAASPASSISSSSSSSSFSFPLSSYIAETCFFLSQNTPTVLLLLPRAALSLSLLLQPPAGPGLGRDGTYFDSGSGALSGYAKGILLANAAWTIWRALLVLGSVIGLWILSGAACGGICGPRYRWEEEPDLEDSRSPPTSPTDTPGTMREKSTHPHTHYPLTHTDDLPLSDTWPWKRGTRARVRDAWEFCLTNTSGGWGTREKENENSRMHGHPREYSTTVVHARHADNPNADDDDLAGLEEVIKRSVLGRSGRQATYSPREGEGLSDIIPPTLSPGDDPAFTCGGWVADTAFGSQRSRRSDPLRVLPFPIRVGPLGGASGGVGGGGATATSVGSIPFPSPTRSRAEKTLDVPVVAKNEDDEDDVEGIEGLDDLEVGDDEDEDNDVDVDIEAEEDEAHGEEADEEEQEHGSMSSLGRPVVQGEKYPFIGLGTGFMAGLATRTASSRNGSRSRGGTVSKSGTQSSKGGTRSSKSGTQSSKSNTQSSNGTGPRSRSGTGSASHKNSHSTYSTHPASTPSHSHSHSHSTHPASSPPNSNLASSPSNPASSPHPPSNLASSPHPPSNPSTTPRSDSSASPPALPPPPPAPARVRRHHRRGTGPLPTGLASSAAPTPRSVGTETGDADADPDALYPDIDALAIRSRTRTMSSNVAVRLSGRMRTISGVEPEPQPEPEVGMVDYDDDFDFEVEDGEEARGRTRPQSDDGGPDGGGAQELESPRSHSHVNGNGICPGPGEEDEDSVGLLSPATRSPRHSLGPSPRASLRSLRSRLSLSVIPMSPQGQGQGPAQGQGYARSVSHSRSHANSLSNHSRSPAISQHSSVNPNASSNASSPATRSRAQSLIQSTRSRTQSFIQRSRASSAVRSRADSQYSGSPHSNSNSNSQYHSPSGGSRRESVIGSGGSRRESSGLESSSGGEREREASHAVGIEETFGRPGELARLREIEERGSGSVPSSPGAGSGLEPPPSSLGLRHAASHTPSDITEMTEMTERAGGVVGESGQDQLEPEHHRLNAERSMALTTETSYTDLSTAHESFVTAPMTIDGSTTTDSIGTASGAHWAPLRGHHHVHGGHWEGHHGHEPA